MSLLKSNSVQIGQSATATQNFTLSVPSSPDGTIKLARGNSGATTADVLTVNASGAITGATITGATITSSTVNGGTITSATAQATTSGTAIDFTGIPSWVKRVTVMFNRTSLSGTDHYLVQIGSGSLTTSGYSSHAGYVVSDTDAGSVGSTSGFVVWGGFASQVTSANVSICLADSSSYIYTSSHSGLDAAGGAFKAGGGAVTLTGLLDRVRITRTGTNTFDASAGSINIMYEG